MEVMKSYLQERLLPINMPLFMINGGETIYYVDKLNDEIIIREYISKYPNSKWGINDKLEPLYEFFGEEAFEDFFKYYFGKDIKDKGNKKYNWIFV